MDCEKKSVRETKFDRSVIVNRIDLIARELSELRRMVENIFPPETSSSVTSELLGCLGSEPLDDYDYSVDWKEFGVDDRLP